MKAIDEIAEELEYAARGIIVKYNTGMLINWEGVLNPDLSQ